MTGYLKCCCLAWALIVSTCAASRAEEVQWPDRDLQFEVLTARHGRERRVPSVVTHYAVIFIGPGKALSNLNLKVRYGPKDSQPSQLLQTNAGQAMSEKQRELLLRENEFLVISMPSARHQERPYVEYTLFAVSEADARRMGEALVQLCDIKGKARLEETKKDLAKYRRLTSETDKRLAELNEKRKAARAEQEQLSKIVWYGSWADGHQDVMELDKALRALEVEMAGIDAKINAVKKLKTDAEFKDQMLARQDVEMASVLARKHAIEAHREKAQQYCTVTRFLERSHSSKSRLKQKLKGYREKVPHLKGILANLPRYMKPLDVLDNRVEIFRFRSPEGTETQPSRKGATRRAR